MLKTNCQNPDCQLIAERFSALQKELDEERAKSLRLQQIIANSEENKSLGLTTSNASKQAEEKDMSKTYAHAHKSAFVDQRPIAMPQKETSERSFRTPLLDRPCEQMANTSDEIALSETPRDTNVELATIPLQELTLDQLATQMAIMPEEIASSELLADTNVQYAAQENSGHVEKQKSNEKPDNNSVPSASAAKKAPLKNRDEPTAEVSSSTKRATSNFGHDVGIAEKSALKSVEDGATTLRSRTASKTEGPTLRCAACILKDNEEVRCGVIFPSDDTTYFRMDCGKSCTLCYHTDCFYALMQSFGFKGRKDYKAAVCPTPDCGGPLTIYQVRGDELTEYLRCEGATKAKDAGVAEEKKKEKKKPTKQETKQHPAQHGAALRAQRDDKDEMRLSVSEEPEPVTAQAKPPTTSAKPKPLFSLNLAEAKRVEKKVEDKYSVAENEQSTSQHGRGRKARPAQKQTLVSGLFRHEHFWQSYDGPDPNFTEKTYQELKARLQKCREELLMNMGASVMPLNQLPICVSDAFEGYSTFWQQAIEHVLSAPAYYDVLINDLGFVTYHRPYGTFIGLPDAHVPTEAEYCAQLRVEDAGPPSTASNRTAPVVDFGEPSQFDEPADSTAFYAPGTEELSSSGWTVPNVEYNSDLASINQAPMLEFSARGFRSVRRMTSTIEAESRAARIESCIHHLGTIIENMSGDHPELVEDLFKCHEDFTEALKRTRRFEDVPCPKVPEFLEHIFADILDPLHEKRSRKLMEAIRSKINMEPIVNWTDSQLLKHVRRYEAVAGEQSGPRGFFNWLQSSFPEAAESLALYDAQREKKRPPAPTPAPVHAPPKVSAPKPGPRTVDYRIHECKICLIPLGGETPKNRIYTCPHQRCAEPFHKECVVGWLAKQSTCPNCREIFHDPEQFPSLAGPGPSSLHNMRMPPRPRR